MKKIFASISSFVKKNEIILKRILRWIFVLMFAVGAIGFVTHFVLAIYRSCVNDDIITAQDRIKSAYQFMYMVFSGLFMVVGAFLQSCIKVSLLDEKTKQFINTKILKK